MDKITGTIESLVLVSDHMETALELELVGEALGDVTVGAGVSFILTGAVRGDVIALKGSSVTVNGYVAGHVVNRGGAVRINGSIGSLVDDDTSPASIAAEAHMRGGARPNRLT